MVSWLKELSTSQLVWQHLSSSLAKVLQDLNQDDYMLYLKSTYCPSDNLVTGVISEFLFPGSVLDQQQTYLTTANPNLVDKNMNTLFCLIFSCSVIIVSVIVARSNTKNSTGKRRSRKVQEPAEEHQLDHRGRHPLLCSHPG